MGCGRSAFSKGFGPPKSPPKSQKQTVVPYNGLKYNDLASLLFALIWSCLLSFCGIWACFAKFALMRGYLEA